MPVLLNDPIGLLQKCAEVQEYNEIFDRATKESDSCKRLAFIAVQQISTFTSIPKRILKPFNPLLGETYELVTPQYRYFAE